MSFLCKILEKSGPTRHHEGRPELFLSLCGGCGGYFTITFFTIRLPFLWYSIR